MAYIRHQLYLYLNQLESSLTSARGSPRFEFSERAKPVCFVNFTPNSLPALSAVLITCQNAWFWALEDGGCYGRLAPEPRTHRTSPSQSLFYKHTSSRQKKVMVSHETRRVFFITVGVVAVALTAAAVISSRRNDNNTSSSSTTVRKSKAFLSPLPHTHTHTWSTGTT